MRTARTRPHSGSDAVLLYRIIFKSKAVLMSVLLLAVSIALQPVDFVYAEESDVTAPGEAAETMETPEETDETETPEEEPATKGSDETTASGEDAEGATEEAPEAEGAPGDTDGTSSDTADNGGPAGTEESQEGDGETSPSDDQAQTDTSSSSTDSDQTEDTGGHSSSTEPSSGGEEPAATSTPETTSPATPTSSPATSTDPGGTEEDTLASTTRSTSSEPIPETSPAGSGGSDGTSDEEEETATTSEPAAQAATSTATTPAPTSTDTPTADTTTAPDDEAPAPTETEAGESASGAGGDTTAPAGATTTATTTPTTPTTTQPVVISTASNPQNRHQFGEADCVSVGDGSYYCSKEQQAPSPSGDRIYAAADTDGDREIFLSAAGKTVQITKNTLDDMAPEYDEGSDSVVWHRLIEGRYQIMQYDLAKNAEYQLTSGSHNSMEPSIEEDHVAWQYWDGEDWEIVLYDGTEMTQLTDNDTPDLSPSIHDGYIIWSTVGRSGQHAAMLYDMARKTTELIEGVEGGSVMNPRFVLVYDTKFDNGDVVTSGYDPSSGGNIHLGALPAELPRNIPDSEPTEEVRALIQNKSPKEESDEMLPRATSSGATSSTSSTSSADTIVPEDQPMSDLDMASTTDEQFALSEYDVVVTDYSTTSAQVNATGSAVNLVE